MIFGLYILGVLVAAVEAVAFERRLLCGRAAGEVWRQPTLRVGWPVRRAVIITCAVHACIVIVFYCFAVRELRMMIAS